MLLYLIELLGVVVFAFSGVLAAGKKSFDWVGVLVIAFVTALGGGTLRDVLLDREKIFWISDTNYIITILVTCALALIYLRNFRPPLKLLLIADALGMALFSIGGAQIAQNYTESYLVIILMGAITGSAGGVIRDILTNRTPLLFASDEPLYSTTSVIGIIVYLGFASFMSLSLAIIIGISLIATLRIAAIIFNWHLPAFKYQG